LEFGAWDLHIYMDITAIKQKAISQKIINDIVARLKRSEVIIFPTDTVYGLGGRADSKKVINKVFKIKGRSKTKALPVFVSSIAMAKKYVYINKKQEEFLRKYWPGKLTAVLKSKDVLPKQISGGVNEIGVRIPSYSLILKIVKKLNCPLIATSANVSGAPSLQSVENVEKCFKVKPDLVLDAGRLPKSKASTVVNLTEDEIVVLRKGAVTVVSRKT